MQGGLRNGKEDLGSPSGRGCNLPPRCQLSHCMAHSGPALGWKRGREREMKLCLCGVCVCVCEGG